MGCGEHCACSQSTVEKVTADEIVEATAPDGTDITQEVKNAVSGGCERSDCQNGECDSCQKDETCAVGDAGTCKTC